MATSGSTRTTLISPFQYFADPTRARPIFNGFIFIGRVDGDPTNTADQIPVQVICECGGSPVNVTQPIRTGPGGLPIYNGSPAQIVVCRSNYSITLQDNNRVQVYHSPNVQSGFVNQPITHTTLAAAMADDNSSRQSIRILSTGSEYIRSASDAEFNSYPSRAKFTDGSSSSLQWVLRIGSFVDPMHLAAVGDGIADDQEALNQSADLCRLLKRNLVIPRIHNTTVKVDLRDIAEVFGYGCDPIPYFDPRTYNGSVVGLDWHNKSATRPPFSFFLPLVRGSAIVSTSNIRIIECSSGTTLFRDFGVFGYLNATSQVGISDGDGRTLYQPTIKGLLNMVVECVNGNGVGLLNGIEFAEIKGCKINHNEGHGIYGTRNNAVQPLDYTVMLGNQIQNNLRDNIFIEGMRVGWSILRNDVSRAGKYQHTSVPSNILDIVAGLTITTRHVGWIVQGSVIKNLTAESTNVLIKLVATHAGSPLGVIKDIEAGGLFQGTYPGGRPSTGILIEGNFTEDLNFYEFETNAQSYINNTITNQTQVGISYPEKWNTVGLNPYVNIPARNYVDKTRLVSFSDSPTPINAIVTTTGIQGFHTESSPANNRGIPASTWVLSTNFQSAGSAAGGAYMLVVHRGGTGGFVMSVLPFSSTTGFTAAPTMAADGTLSIPLAAFHQYTLTKLDSLGINSESL